MTSPLKLLFDAINQARSEHEMRSQIVPKIGEYFAASPRPDHWYVMAGPIINRNQLVGVVGCTREKSRPAFDRRLTLNSDVFAANLASLSLI